MSASHIEQLIDRLGTVAGLIEGRKPDAEIQAALRNALTDCQRAAADSRGEPQALLRNFTQALQTWDRVWPQMGARAEFRLAVVREARQWASRLTKTAA